MHVANTQLYNVKQNTYNMSVLNTNASLLAQDQWNFMLGL